MKIKHLSDWEKSLAPIIEDMGGRPLRIHALLANHPALLQALWPLRMYLVNGGDLTRRHCELVILRTAAHMENWYEWASHVVRGLDSGLSADEIENVRDPAGNWSEADAVLLTAVDELMDGNVINPATLERLAPHFTDQQVLDVMHLKGMYTTIGCAIDTWGLELDEHVAARLPDAPAAKDFQRD